jgi:hypothetical protein
MKYGISVVEKEGVDSCRIEGVLVLVRGEDRIEEDFITLRVASSQVEDSSGCSA